jgi:hypothetical protein
MISSFAYALIGRQKPVRSSRVRMARLRVALPIVNLGAAKSPMWAGNRQQYMPRKDVFAAVLPEAKRVDLT